MPGSDLLPTTDVIISIPSLVGLFQINITFGLLYIGLPELRFRSNLYDNIVDAVNYHRYNVIYRKVSETEQDGDLSDSYHTIMGWIYKLPAEMKYGLKIDLDTYAPRTTGNWLSSYHDHFTKDRDKLVVWVFTVAPAFVVIWLRYFSPEILEKFYNKFSIVAGFGICSPIILVFLGYMLARTVKGRLDRSLETIKDKFGRDDLDDVLDDLSKDNPVS